jgi:hypothetical protein
VAQAAPADWRSWEMSMAVSVIADILELNSL